MLYEAHIDTTRPDVRIITRPQGRTYITSQANLAEALTRAQADALTASRSRTVRWVDLLASHGVAVGRRGESMLQLAIIPGGPRTIRWSGNWVPPGAREGRSEQLDLALTFPPMFVALRTTADRYRHALIYLFRAAAQPTLAVTSTSADLVGYPWGNVYPEGHICWGSVPHAQITSIPLFLHAFFGSTFNNDLYYGGSALPRIAQDSRNILPVPATFTISIATAIERLLQHD